MKQGVKILTGKELRLKESFNLEGVYKNQPAHRQADRRMQKARHTDRSRHLLCGRARRGRCLGEHGAFNEPCRKQNPCRLFVNGNEL